MRINNIVIFELGKEVEGIYYRPSLRVKLPKEPVKIMLGFDHETDAGQALNFKRKGRKIFCDVVIKDKHTIEGIKKKVIGTIAPTIRGDLINKNGSKAFKSPIELIRPSIVVTHSDNDRNSNLLWARR